jgi:hypothetical protein
MYRRFGTLCSIFIGRVDKTDEDGTDSVPKRLYIKFRHQGNHPKERIQHSQHGKSLKSRTKYTLRRPMPTQGCTAYDDDDDDDDVHITQK